jgi:hypothetical protein
VPSLTRPVTRACAKLGCRRSEGRTSHWQSSLTRRCLLSYPSLVIIAKLGTCAWGRAVQCYPDHAPPSQDYRQLAHRLRELARETSRPFARQELLRLSGIYDRRAEHRGRRAG